jgi:undecaprenyl-diphosphatase
MKMVSTTATAPAVRPKARDDTRERVSQPAERATLRMPRPSYLQTGVAAGSVAGLLTADAVVNDQAFFDVWVSNQVQRIDFPYLADAVHAVSTLTSSSWAIGMWALTFLVFAALRWWLPALATLTLPVGGALNQVIGEYVVGRTRPDPDQIMRTVPDIQAASFPSGHVMGAVMLYGMLFFLARRIAFAPLRIAIQVLSTFVIAAVGFVRVWEGAHWSTDVIGAYAFGTLFLVVLFAAYNRIEAAAGHLPFIRAGVVPHDEGQPHAHALTSTVVFRGETVAKIYNPGFLPRALYWLSFQAPFPYVANRAAIDAAQQRRELAGMLTEYWYGSRRVARMVGVEQTGDQYALVSEFVEGHEPSDKAQAKAFLRDLRARFQAAGLPTWQIDPRQPRAVDNLLETRDGTYQIVDLESGLVAPLASIKTWLRAIRRGAVPMFDEVFFDVTREYVATEAESMRATMGDAWFARLNETVNSAEAATAEWHSSEPRIPSKIVGGIWTGYNYRTWPARIKAQTAAGQERAMRSMLGAVDTWLAEGRMSEREAAAVRAQMETPQFQAVMPHLGAHIIITVILRFPFGSMARVAWSSWALMASTGRLLARRIDRKEWKRAFDIHSPFVIALSAIPGFGAFAYLAAKPVRSNRLLVRVMVDAMMLKVPGKLYERMGMRRLIARRPDAVTAQTRPVDGFEHMIPEPVRSLAPVPVPLTVRATRLQAAGRNWRQPDAA